MKLLLPLDLIRDYKQIVAALTRTISLQDCDVKLLYVREMLPAYENVMKTVGNFPDDWETQLNEKANAYFDKVSAELKPHCKSITTEVTSGPAAMMIDAVAKDEKFDLIVVSPGEHNPLQRAFTGSTSMRILTHSSRSVALLRTQKSSKEFKSVVIGLDGSKSSKLVVERAVETYNLRQKGVRVTAVHSVDVAQPLKLFSPVAFISALEQDLLMRGEVFLAETKKQLTDAGVSDVRCALVEGEPAASLIKVISEADADLVILGATGDYPTHLGIGDTAFKVSTHAPCSVAVVRTESNKKHHA